MTHSRTNLFLIALVAFVLLSGCRQKEQKPQQDISKQEMAEDIVRGWMLNSKEYPHYKSIVFGDLTPRFEYSALTLPLTLQIAEEGKKAPEERNLQLLDSLNSEWVKQRGKLLGYLLPHKFQQMNIAGEVLQHELLFFLDSTLRVASVLSSESFDYILDEKVFFRLDSIPK